MIPKLFLTIGLPCSGKSTYAKELAEKYNALILSSDELREEMFGDVNHQEDNDKLFKELHHRIRFHLYNGNSVVYDACSISYKRRMEFLKSLNQIPCEKIAVLMATPYEICLERNKNRDRHVPEYIIKRMYLNFEVPYWHENFDDIWIKYAPGAENCYGDVCDWISSVMNYDQHNSHHTLTLGKHCLAAFNYLDKIAVRRWEIRTAALIHDCGKPKTATYINSKGEITEERHTYQHQNVGCYDSLFFSGIDDHLYVACLIQWHMRPYLAWDKSEKARKKDKALLGEELYNEICLLNKADRSAK